MRVWMTGTVAALTLAGCSHGAASGSADSTPPPGAALTNAAPPGPAANAAQSAADDQASDELRDHHRHHHHGGVARFIAMSIDTLGVAPENEARLQQIQRRLHEQMAPSRDAERKLLSALAEGIAAGAVDGARLSAALDEMDRAGAAVHAASLDALNELHAALSPAERAALVEKVQAHWEVWRKVNAAEGQGNRERDGHLARLAQRLKLSPDQVERISSALKSAEPAKADPDSGEEHVRAFARAFAADTFDARSLGPPGAGAGQAARSGTARMVRFYEIVTPLLTPEQRTALANHLRDRANDSHAVSSN
jgi:Spy/CpxP family protein refolding chaperone